MSVDIVIRYNGTNITSSVMFETCNFTAQLNAIPGTFEFTVRDLEQTHSFVTGKEVTLDIDGVRLWGGYVTQISRTHAFAADDTSVPANYPNRWWILRGVDYNILFDKRVLRNTANYLKHPAAISGSTMDGTALSNMLDDFVDVPSGFDITTHMDDIVSVKPGGGGTWAYVQQGTKIREQFEQLSLRSAAVYYIDADKNFHYHSVEDIESRWGFSDDPNFNTITTSPVEFQDATYGFREVEAIEDGSGIVNDALIWGGSEWAGTGGTVFSREEDATSQSTHGRWQLGEVHFGEQGFGIQAGVDARAEAIVSGPPGADAYGQLKGLRFNQWSARFAWHDKDVPSISGTKDHLRPGQLVTIDLAVFGETKLLPLRSMRISFPELDPSEGGDPYVRFEGEFGLQLTDPFTIWRYLLRRGTPAVTGGNLMIASVNNDSDVTAYGAYYQDEPSPATDGVQAVFTIPYGYISGTVEVYKNGILQTEGTAWTATDPTAGEITFATPPAAGSDLWVVARTLAE